MTRGERHGYGAIMNWITVRRRIWHELKWVGRVAGETVQNFGAANPAAPNVPPPHLMGHQPPTVGTRDLGRGDRAPGGEPRA